MLVKTAAALVAKCYMQCEALPIKVCDTLDKIIRDFLLGSNEEKRKLHMVKWSIVTLPKDLEGLGLHSMKERNLDILAKLCWRLNNDQGAPWEKLLAEKYLTPKRFTGEERKSHCSSVWATCKKRGLVYVKGLKWSVRNGESIKFWMDFWLLVGSLHNLIEGPLNRDEEQRIVNQYFDAERKWIAQSISFELPDHLLNAIKATLLVY